MAPPVGPVLLLVLGFEERPKVITLARVEDEPRLADWLGGDPRIAELLTLAATIIHEPPLSDVD
jgi:hypothetical protein